MSGRPGKIGAVSKELGAAGNRTLALCIIENDYLNGDNRVDGGIRMQPR